MRTAILIALAFVAGVAAGVAGDRWLGSAEQAPRAH